MMLVARDGMTLECDVKNSFDIEVVDEAKCSIMLKITNNTPEKVVVFMKIGNRSFVECVLVYQCSADKKTDVLLKRELGQGAVFNSLISCADAGSHTLHRSTSLSENSTSDEAEVFLGHDSQTFTLTHEVVNQMPGTKATVLTKGVLLDKSKAFCKGNMIIAPLACCSSSWLGQHVLLLSKDAKADAVPCLEIKNNEVKAYHAATVAPLDDQHLFYLTSRGISLNKAKRMIAEAFLLPLIERVSLLQIRELVQAQIHSGFEVLYASA